MRKCLVVVVVLLLSLAITSMSFADSPGKKKIIAGAVLIPSGFLLGAVVFNQCFLSNCSGDEATMVIALGMIGAGTTLLIWGLIQRARAPKADSLLPVNSKKPEFALALFPVRKGVAAGAVIRW